MKFLHAHTKVTSRKNSQKTATQSAAYRNGYGKFSNRKDQVVHTQILLPPNCPHADFFSDPQALWELVDLTEKRKDAQLFREFECDLYNELPFEDQLIAITKFCQEQFTEKGMIANLAIHKNQSGMHCHIMLTMREIEQNSKFPKFGKKQREWNNKDLVPEWRMAWQNKLNQLAEIYDVEKVSLSSIETEKEIAIEQKNWLLAAELDVKQKTKIPHKTRAKFSYFIKERKLQKIDFLKALQKMRLKHNERRFEMLSYDKLKVLAKTLQNSSYAILRGILEKELEKQNSQNQKNNRKI